MNKFLVGMDKYHRTDRKCRAIANISEHKGALLKLTTYLLKDMQAVALAAPQIGYDITAFSVRTAELPKKAQGKGPITLFINPEIISRSVAGTTLPEACRSAEAYDIPELNQTVPVHRYNVIELRYLTGSGTEKQVKLTGYAARIVQHEIDHLHGISIYTKDKS